MQSNATHTDFRNNKRLHVVLLFVVSLGFYFNTIFNEYALDDVVVVTDNDFVHQGLKGIPQILTSDYFLGYEGVQNDLSGGRYRPLSLVVFAMEYALFGENPLISHAINVILYSCLILLLYLFFSRFIFQSQPIVAFLSLLIFCIHPIHTEVVANIKSRDELIVLLLLCGSLYSLFKHVLIKRSLFVLLISVVCFFLALLTKENAIVFLAVIPLLFYFFANKSLKQSIVLTLPIFIISGFYLIIRFLVVGFSHSTSEEILNAPFLYASASEALATKVYVLGRYLQLLVLPYPLSYDYSYNEIAYVKLTDIQFVLSLLVNAALLIYAAITFKRRNIVSFCILFYFITISIVSNFVIDVGAPMGERFLFQPSIAFSIVIGYFIARLYRYNNTIAVSLIVVLVVASGIFTINRNTDWKNNDTLFLKDVEACPNSAKTNDNAGVSLLRMAKAENNPTKKQKLFEQAIAKSSKAIKIHPKYVDAHLNLGTMYFNLDDKKNAARVWLKAKQLSPAHPKAKEFTEGLSGVYAKEGYTKYEQGDINEAIDYFNKALQLNSKNIDAWYNLGGNYLLKRDTLNAINAWENTIKLQPNHPYANSWLIKITNNK